MGTIETLRLKVLDMMSKRELSMKNMRKCLNTIIDMMIVKSSKGFNKSQRNMLPRDKWNIVVPDARKKYSENINKPFMKQLTPDIVKEEKKEITDFPRTGTFCTICKNAQYDTPSGPVCKENHDDIKPNEETVNETENEEDEETTEKEN